MFAPGETCPFLTPDRLCRIHAELGEDFLPDTCAVFPRHFRARKDWIEISASLACPEIARRARPFFECHGFVLENYLVNYLLHHDLCFHQGRRLYEDYVMMVLNFTMLKTYLIGMAAWHREGMNPAMVTRLIYSFTKVVEPDGRFRDYALGLLAQSGCTDMMHLAVLIKN